MCAIRTDLMNGRICTQESLPATSTRQHIQHTPTSVCAPFWLCVRMRTDIGYGLNFFLFPASAIANYRSTHHSFLANIRCRSKNDTAKTLGEPKKKSSSAIYIYINSICFCAARGESRHSKLLRLSECGKSKKDKLWFAQYNAHHLDAKVFARCGHEKKHSPIGLFVRSCKV